MRCCCTDRLALGSNDYRDQVLGGGRSSVRPSPSAPSSRARSSPCAWVASAALGRGGGAVRSCPA